MTLQTISASKLKTFRTCHRQYYYKYVLPKDERPPDNKNIGALFGTSLHKAIERKYRVNDNPRLVFQKTMLETLDQWEEEGYRVKGVEWFGKSMKDGKLILEEFDWLRFQPIELEYEFTLPFPNSTAPIVLINGYIDLVDQQGDILNIVDHKSQRNRPNQDQLNHDSQFVIYAWAAQQIYGRLPNATIWNDLRKNQLITVDVLTDFDFKLSQLTLDIDALMNTNKYPRRQMDRVCTTECSFYQLCYGLTAKQQEAIEEDED